MKVTRVEVRLDPETDATLDRLVSQLHINRSAVIRLAIWRLLDERILPKEEAR